MMKKIWSLFLAVLMILSFSLSAFAGSDGSSSQTVLRFTYENRVYFDPNEGINAILSYSCENPYVVIEENPDAAERINSVLEPYNASYVASDDGVALNMDRETYLLSLAEDHYSLRSGDGSGESLLFSFSHRCSVVRCDESLLVLCFTDYLDDIEHTDITSDTFYFDLTTGNQLTEAEAALRPEAAGISGTGSCGIFTEEQFASEGFTFDGLNADSFAVTDLLETTGSGIPCFLCVSGKANSIRLSSVVRYDQWYEKQQLWYCSEMKNEALQLLVPQPTADTAIKLTYLSGGQLTEKLITADSAGNILLSDPLTMN